MLAFIGLFSVPAKGVNAWRLRQSRQKSRLGCRQICRLRSKIPDAGLTDAVIAISVIIQIYIDFQNLIFGKFVFQFYRRKNFRDLPAQLFFLGKAQIFATCWVMVLPPSEKLLDLKLLMIALAVEEKLTAP